jgi:hypothetical protein
MCMVSLVLLFVPFAFTVSVFNQQWTDLFGWRRSGGNARTTTAPATDATITDEVESEWLHALGVQLSGGDADRGPADPSSSSSASSATPSEPIDDPPSKDERGYVWMPIGGINKKLGSFLSLCCP